MITAEQAKELLAAATQSPWKWERYGGLAELSGRAGDHETYEYDSPVLEFTHNGGCGCRAACYAEVDLTETDAALIAAAPDLAQAVIDLTERAEKAEAKIDIALVYTREAEEAAKTDPVRRRLARIRSALGW